MRALVLTDDSVLVSYLEALLADAGIGVVVLDRNLSQLHGAVGKAGFLAGLLLDRYPGALAKRYGLDEANEAFRALAAGELARGLIVF